MAIAPNVQKPVAAPGPLALKDDRSLRDVALLSPQHYIADATARIHDATRRVRVMALTIADERETGELINALRAAAARGVSVHVAADTFTYADIRGSFMPKAYLPPRRRRSLELTRKLTEAGVVFDWLGRDKGLPWRGRTHTKFCVVDDTVYSFGGVNLDDQGVNNVDYMLCVEDARVAQDLCDLYERTRNANLKKVGHRSASIKYGKDQMLVDGGIVGDSIIYRRALKHARKAQRILLISQYCPTGELGRAIKAKPHRLFFNPPGNASFFNRILIRASMIATRTSTSYRRDKYLHAKCIIFYFANGKRIAITGSHNFVRGGVNLGTREIALQTKNPMIIDQIEDFFHSQVDRRD